MKGTLDARQLQTECEVLQSEIVLSNVINDLNLNQEWGIQFGNGVRLTTADTMQLLKRTIDARPVHDSDIIQILCYSHDAKEAAGIVSALAQSYCKYLLQSRKESSIGVASMPVLAGQIVDRASPDLRPALPNRQQDILLGFWEAIWWGILVGAFVVWIGLRFAKKHRTHMDPMPKEMT